MDNSGQGMGEQQEKFIKSNQGRNFIVSGIECSHEFKINKLI